MGSSPNSPVYEADKAYFANAALYQNAAHSALAGSRTLIFSAVAAQESSRRLALARSQGHKLVVINIEKSDSLDIFDSAKAHFEQAEYLSISNRISIITSSSGLTEPIRSESFQFLGLATRAKMRVKCTATHWARALGRNSDFPAYFRISTGVFSLCYAIFENGAEPEYFLSGINPSQWNKIEAERTLHKWKPTSHNEADLTVLKALFAQYKIYSESKDLQDLGARNPGA